MYRSKLKSMVAVVAAIILVASRLEAQVSFVGNRTDLIGPTLDWTALYGSPTGIPVTTGFVPTGIPSLYIQVMSQADITTGQQTLTYNGTFSPYDPILFAVDAPLIIMFSQDILGFGAQVGDGGWGTFSSVMTAYDAVGASLGEFTVSNVSTGGGGNLASFLGIRSQTGMRSVSFRNSPPLSRVLTINQATIELMPTSDVVPEPGTMLLLATGGTVLALGRRKKKSD